MSETFQITSTTGVDVNVCIAGPGARSYAFVVDWHIRLVLAMAWFVIAALLYSGTLELIDAESPAFSGYFFVVLLPAIAIYALYHPVLEVLMAGRTPGKRIAGVRIVTTDAQVPGVLALLIRNVLRLVDSLPFGYVVGLISTVATARSVRIGDLAAGTLLAYENTQQAAPAPGFSLQPALAEGHNGSVDRFGVDAEAIAKTELVQDLVERWQQLAPEKRQQLAAKLLNQLAPEQAAPHGPQTADEKLKQQLQALLR